VKAHAQSARAAKASDIKYADLDQSTPYMRLTLRNIGQRHVIFSCPINYLRANAMQPTNQGVGSSNLSGRQIIQLHARTAVRYLSQVLYSPARISGWPCVVARCVIHGLSLDI